jgi:hypothetical protein
MKPWDQLTNEEKLESLHQRIEELMYENNRLRRLADRHTKDNGPRQDAGELEKSDAAGILAMSGL